MDVSTWLDVPAFLADIKPFINRLEKNRWMAFSMPDGYVYVQPKVLEQVARWHSARAGIMEIMDIPAGDPDMRFVLLAVVNRLRRESDVIATELIGEDYFGGFFRIVCKDGSKIRGYYTPFLAEAFGPIAELEAAKRGRLRLFRGVEVSWTKKTRTARRAVAC